MAMTLASKGKKAWEALDAPWRLALELAWEAYRSGTMPEAAVVVDGRNRIVGRARNHVFDDNGTVGLSRSVLSHAVVNALASLDAYERHEDLTVYATLEPCALCLGAASAATVGAVRFAAPDAYSGSAGLTVLSPHALRRPLVVEGPLPGPFGVLAGVLNLELYLRVNPDGHVVAAHRQYDPELLARAEAVRDSGLLTAAKAKSLPLAGVVHRLWKHLV